MNGLLTNPVSPATQAEEISLMAGSCPSSAHAELIEHVTCAWVRELPTRELANHYGKALALLDKKGRRRLVKLYERFGIEVAGPGREVLMNSSHRLTPAQLREALKLAAVRTGYKAAAADSQAVTIAFGAVAEWLSEDALQVLHAQVADTWLQAHTGSLN